MSEQNNLKLLYATAQTTDDLDLFLYTGLSIVGRDGLIQIVADVIFDRLVQTCKNQKELALEMGCNDFVTKPVSERTLRKALDKYSTIV